MSDKDLHFLQPGSDQAISVLRLIKGASKNLKVIAVANVVDDKSKGQWRKYGYDDVADISEIENRCAPEMLVPFGAPSTEKLLRSGPVHVGEIKMMPSALQVYDKLGFVSRCEKNNIPVPKTTTKAENFQANDYPIFYKQKWEKGGGIRGLAWQPSDLPAGELHNLILQEYIESEGTFGVAFIAEYGELKVSFSHHELVSNPSAGGSAVVVRKFQDDRLLELTKAILKTFSYSGWGLAEFKYCHKRRDYVVMEVNAKFWASCEMAFRNEPEFMRSLFGVSLKSEHLRGLIYLNRALGLGWLKALKILISTRDCQFVVYPGFIRTLFVGMVPKKAQHIIRRKMKRKTI
ncbi:MAG: hypothetical protein ACQEV6_03235 [Pseudomonadota bacterium]